MYFLEYDLFTILYRQRHRAVEILVFGGILRNEKDIGFRSCIR